MSWFPLLLRPRAFCKSFSKAFILFACAKHSPSYVRNADSDNMWGILYHVDNGRIKRSRLLNQVSAFTKSFFCCSSASISSWSLVYAGACCGFARVSFVAPSGFGSRFRETARRCTLSRALSMVHNAAHT